MRKSCLPLPRKTLPYNTSLNNSSRRIGAWRFASGGELVREVAATYVQLRALEERLRLAQENVQIQSRVVEGDRKMKNGWSVFRALGIGFGITLVLWGLPHIGFAQYTSVVTAGG